VIHLRQRLRELREDLGYREDDPTIKQKYLRRPTTNVAENADCKENKVERTLRGEIPDHGDSSRGSATGISGRAAKRSSG
jgi:hypothetical protein